VLLVSLEGVKGDPGSGRWPASAPPKLLRVGVFAEESSVRESSAGRDSEKKVAFGRGVVGVVSSPDRDDGGSGTARVVLTAWNADIAAESQMRARLRFPVGGVVFGRG
jgi:hypothetical protein